MQVFKRGRRWTKTECSRVAPFSEVKVDTAISMHMYSALHLCCTACLEPRKRARPFVLPQALCWHCLDAILSLNSNVCLGDGAKRTQRHLRRGDIGDRARVSQWAEWAGDCSAGLRAIHHTLKLLHRLHVTREHHQGTEVWYLQALAKHKMLAAAVLRATGTPVPP